MTHDWPVITKDEIVDVIAPSGSFQPSDLIAIRDYLFACGLTPRIPENILSDYPFSANTDEVRFELLKNALHAEDSTLIWCVRGGHGVTRIMPELAGLPKPKKQKLLVGFSDISSLHLWLNQAWHWPSLQGPQARMTALGQVDPQDVAALHQLWLNGLDGYTLPELEPINQSARMLEQVTGITAGGCLSVLQTSMGTPWQLQGADKILFLEDINEQPYRVDRSLIHLANAQIFSQAKAVVIGDFGEEEIENPLFDWALRDVFEQYLPKRGFTIPAFRLRGFGHAKRNKPIPFGVSATVRIDNSSWRLDFGNK